MDNFAHSKWISLHTCYETRNFISTSTEEWMGRADFIRRVPEDDRRNELQVAKVSGSFRFKMSFWFCWSVLRKDLHRGSQTFLDWSKNEDVMLRIQKGLGSFVGYWGEIWGFLATDQQTSTSPCVFNTCVVMSSVLAPLHRPTCWMPRAHFFSFFSCLIQQCSNDLLLWFCLDTSLLQTANDWKNQQKIVKGMTVMPSQVFC